MPYHHDILPVGVHNGPMLQNVALVVLGKFTSFEFGIVAEVFGIDRTHDGLPAYEFAVVAGEEGLLQSEHGLTVAGAFGLDPPPRAGLGGGGAVDEGGRGGTAGGPPQPPLFAPEGAGAR